MISIGNPPLVFNIYLFSFFAFNSKKHLKINSRSAKFSLKMTRKMKIHMLKRNPIIYYLSGIYARIPCRSKCAVACKTKRIESNFTTIFFFSFLGLFMFSYPFKMMGKWMEQFKITSKVFALAVTFRTLLFFSCLHYVHTTTL